MNIHAVHLANAAGALVKQINTMQEDPRYQAMVLAVPESERGPHCRKEFAALKNALIAFDNAATAEAMDGMQFNAAEFTD
jgi:hypothetical protein